MRNSVLLCRFGANYVGILLRNGTSLAPGDEPICQFDTHLVGLKGDPVLKRQEILFGDLADLPLLLPSKPGLTRTAVCSLAESRGIPLSIVAEVNTHGCTQSLFMSGAGYLIVPIGRGSAMNTGYIGKQLKDGHLEVARICDPDLDRTLVVASGSNKAERVEMVRRAAIDVLRALSDQIQ